MTLVRVQRQPEVIESDICIIGSGITAALVAEKLVEERDARIVVVEAGDETVPLPERAARRARFLAYGESPWGRDHVDGMTADGIQSRSMQVGGLAMHWGGVTPRFSPEDFRVRSMYGVGADWPVSYEDLEPFYHEAERRIGVAGEQGPPELDPRASPFPMPALPLTLKAPSSSFHTKSFCCIAELMSGSPTSFAKGSVGVRVGSGSGGAPSLSCSGSTIMYASRPRAMRTLSE